MMTKLEYSKGTDPQRDILNYVMVKTINNYNEKNMIIRMEDLWAKYIKNNLRNIRLGNLC